MAAPAGKQFPGAERNQTHGDAVRRNRIFLRCDVRPARQSGLGSVFFRLFRNQVPRRHRVLRFRRYERIRPGIAAAVPISSNSIRIIRMRGGGSGNQNHDKDATMNADIDPDDRNNHDDDDDDDDFSSLNDDNDHDHDNKDDDPSDDGSDNENEL